MATAFAAHAQTYERYLIPVISPQDIPGANGSLWRRELWIHNPRETSMTIRGDICIIAPFCGSEIVPPHRDGRILGLHRGDIGDGAFLYVPEEPNAPRTPLTLRVRDLSNNAQSFGTEIPIARDADFAQLIIITSVPTDARYRATLRVYSASEAPREVRVRVVALDGMLIDERMVPLAGIVTVAPNPMPYHPSYAELDPLTPAVRASTFLVRIEVEDPLRQIVSPPPPPIWAFVSITDNVTQHVTTITPHP